MLFVLSCIGPKHPSVGALLVVLGLHARMYRNNQSVCRLIVTEQYIFMISNYGSFYIKNKHTLLV